MNFIDYLFADKTDSHSIALTGDFGELTFNQIFYDVCAISGWIQESYRSDTNFLLISDNSPFFVKVYFAVIHSGNRVVLVDPKTSLDDIVDIVSRCKPVAIFSDRKLDDKIKLICEILSPEIIDILPKKGYLPSQGGDYDCAVIIFTSGSTGSKKGVMLSHQNLIANTSSIIQYLNITNKDRICVVLPFFYCYGASLLHTHIKAGGSVVLAQSIFLGSVIRSLNEYQCTGFAGVPSTYLILSKKTPFLSSSFPSLRTLQQAGGHLPHEVIRQFVSAFPDKNFIVMYGATEASARLSYLHPDELFRRPDSIGKGIPGVELAIHDEGGNLVEPGIPGEIVARGDNIMLGYYQDPCGTEEVIYDGWYHTGDLGTFDEEGYIYITGRKGTFIKSAGFKVSPLEIEDILLRTSHVEGCLVIGVPHPLMGEAIIACVQSRSQDESLVQNLLDYCRCELPTHKVPVDIILLDNIPLNSSGKPDRQMVIKEVQRKISNSGSVCHREEKL